MKQKKVGNEAKKVGKTIEEDAKKLHKKLLDLLKK